MKVYGNKTGQNCAIWNRQEKRRTMNKNDVRILYVDTIEIRLLDIPRALDELGFDVYKASLHISVQDYQEMDYRKLKAAIIEFEIQCAITQDFVCSVAQACYETGIPYISWVYDAPQKELYTHYAHYPCNYIFVFDKKQREKMRKIGIENVYYMPLAVHANKIRKILEEIPDRQYENEIAFIGQLYNSESSERILELSPKEIREEVEGILTSHYLSWDDNTGIYDELSKESVQFFGEVENHWIKEKYPYMTEQFYYETVLSGRLLAGRERVAVFNKLAERYEVKFYTSDESTTQLNEMVIVLPPVHCDDEITRVYHKSKINLNITLHCIESGASQRIFDVMAAGGFLISNYQKELVELFEPGKELVLFHNEQELLEQVEYYLSHDEEREEIARRGQEKVLKCHNYHEKLQQMIEFVAVKEQPRQKTYIALKRDWLFEQTENLLAQKTEQAYASLYDLFMSPLYETVIANTTSFAILWEMLQCWHLASEVGKSLVFKDVSNLKEAEKKYLSVKHCMWRIEKNCSDERCQEAVDELCEKKVSKVLIARVICASLQKHEEVFLKLSHYMKQNSIMDAIEILSYGLLFYTHNKSLLLQKADYLMELGLWQEVLKTLKQIDNPEEAILEMIENLQNMLGERQNE